MEKKIAIVTGATGGMGAVTAEAIAATGAITILVGRNEQEGIKTVGVIQEKTSNSEVLFLRADLSSQKSIRDLATTIRSKYDSLDVLVNNVGAVFNKRIETVDGIEMTFALNHLSYFLLTHLLFDLLKKSASARIINVSSATHAGVKPENIEDWQARKKYSMIQAYHRSKLANLFFTYELARRLEGTKITANAVKPGFTRSGLGKGSGGSMAIFLRIMSSLMAKSTEEGARTAIYLATSPEVEGISGKYFDDHDQISSSPQSYNEQLARDLWTLSEKLTQVKFL